MTFKAAYVRHTIDHEVIASSVFGFAVLALLPIFLHAEKRKLIRWFAGAATVVLLFFAMPLSLPLDYPLVFRYPAMLAENVLRFCFRIGPCLSYLGGHSTYSTDFQNRMAEIRQKHDLPKIDGSVDIYPTMSNVMIAYGFDYKPRPIFQSYLAYRQPLTKINVDHLQSTKAAGTLVIQEMKDLYGYYPLLYDGPSWPDILAKYEPKSLHTGGLLLSKRPKPLSMRMTHLEQRTADLDQVIELRDTEGKILFAKIKVAMTPLGAVQKLFFRIYPPKIEVVCKDGTKQQFNAPSEIMKAGFIISPFAESPEQIQSLFPGMDKTANAGKELSAFKIIEIKNDFPWSVFAKQFTFESQLVDINGDTMLSD